jgi:small GTP-binding protein
MGLLSILRQQKRRDREIRVLVLGLDNAGKTTIVRRYLGDDEAVIRQTAPTEGFCIRTKTFTNGYRMHLWDVGGQRALRAYWRNYFERTDALIWVVDATTPSRAQEEAATELAALLSEPSLYQVPLLILANKTDLAAAQPLSVIRAALGLSGLDAHPPLEKSLSLLAETDLIPKSDATSAQSPAWPASDLSQVDAKRSCLLVACSAYTGQGLAESLTWLLEQITQRLYRFDSRCQTETCPLDNTLTKLPDWRQSKPSPSLSRLS